MVFAGDLGHGCPTQREDLRRGGRVEHQVGHEAHGRSSTHLCRL